MPEICAAYDKFGRHRASMRISQYIDAELSRMNFPSMRRSLESREELQRGGCAGCGLGCYWTAEDRGVEGFLRR
jgi:hypothetical protein